MNNRKQSIAVSIRKARLEPGISQKELGRHFGCSDVSISEMERAVSNVDIPSLEKLATILGKPLYWFISDEVELSPRPPEVALSELEVIIGAFIPVYDKIPMAGAVQPIDWIACTRIKPSPKSYIGYRVKGLCLEPDIKDGDTLIVDIERTPNNGDLVICIVEGQASVKKYHNNGTDKWLEDNKEKYQIGDISIHEVITEYNRKYPF